jgi:peptidyl-prolyl cis-trans isomerase SurA
MRHKPVRPTPLSTRHHHLRAAMPLAFPLARAGSPGLDASSQNVPSDAANPLRQASSSAEQPPLRLRLERLRLERIQLERLQAKRRVAALRFDPSSAAKRPRKTQANFSQLQSAQPGIGFVPAYCTIPGPHSRQPVPPGLPVRASRPIRCLSQTPEPRKAQVQPRASFPQRTCAYTPRLPHLSLRDDNLNEVDTHFREIAALLMLALTAARADIIDRVAVSVGNRVITASGLDRQLRVAAFQDGVKPDFSPAVRRAAADRMVEQKLIQFELANSRYPVPGAAELTPAIEQFKKDHFPNEAAYQQALAQYGITEEDFKDLLLWQRTLLLFIEIRFEAGAAVTEPEIQDYFDKTVKPAAEAAHPGQPVDLEDYREQIEKTLAGQRADKQMDTWLQEARKRTDIVYHDEVFQ